LKDFDLHGLLAQHPLQFSYALLERPDFTGADNLVVSLNCGLASVAHELPPAKQLAGREAISAGDVRDVHARLQRLLDQLNLLGHCPPSTVDSGQHLHHCFPVSTRSGHRASPISYGWQGVRSKRGLLHINPQRFRGERRYSYSLGDRLGQVGAVQYGHDKSGFRNLKIEATSSGQRETHYHYEPSGLLLRVDLPDGRRIDYAYDAKGQRTEKRINGRVVEAYDWLDPLRLSEFHDGREWWRLAYLEGRPPVGVTNGDDSYLFATDQVGTPLALATPDGNIVQTTQYDGSRPSRWCKFRWS